MEGITVAGGGMGSEEKYTAVRMESQEQRIIDKIYEKNIYD